MSTPESRFKMPEVHVGDVVLWSHSRDGEKSPALVVKVGVEVVSVHVHVPGLKDHFLKTGVRHFDDPWLGQHAFHDEGVWCLTASHVILKARLDALEAFVQGFQDGGE